MVLGKDRTSNIGTAETAGRIRNLQIDRKDTLFEREWDELVIRFDVSRDCFEVETLGGGVDEPISPEFMRSAAAEGKK
jgi:hypothetical protein